MGYVHAHPCGTPLTLVLGLVGHAERIRFLRRWAIENYLLTIICCYQAEALIEPVGEGTGAMPNYRRGVAFRAQSAFNRRKRLSRIEPSLLPSISVPREEKAVVESVYPI